MTRIGINPARGKYSDYRPARVTTAILTYVPSLEGYFSERLEVLKLVFASLKMHTHLATDVLVFDNGSCPQAIDFLESLKAAGEIDFLLQSRQNIGKIGALKILFEAAPGEIIAYNDDDIFFYPGWLEASLAVLDSFPQVGMVSTDPVRNANAYARQSLDRLIANPPAGITCQQERRIPDAWEIDWALSTGRNPEQHLKDTREWLDVVLKLERPLGTLEAFGGSNHYQFIARKDVILKAMPNAWSGKLMGAMIEMDEAIDQMGYLRLATSQRLSRHIGNTLNAEMRQEATRQGLDVAFKPAKHPVRRPKSALLRIPGARRVFTWCYQKLFDTLYR